LAHAFDGVYSCSAGHYDRLATGQGSWQAIQKFGFHFVATSTWDPVAEQYGALPFIYGTAISSLIALLIAVPLSIATAVYLTELAPLWMRQPIVSLIEMLAAIPSVILGLWGIFVMIPWLRDHPFPFLQRILGWTPFFSGPIYGPVHARWWNHCCDYGSADHYVGLARDIAQRS
jgi:ABC-type phosphate transport system permease subunit